MTTKPYYECHITILEESNNREAVRKEVESLGWTFSAIDNDIILGEGIKLYATKHFNERNGDFHTRTELQFAASGLRLKFKVIRMKVEKVIFDERIKP